MHIPKFEDRQLDELADSLRRRRRALRNKSRSINLDRVIESTNGQRIEKLELTIELSVPSLTTIRVFVWADRFIWVDARRGSKDGWTFSWTKEGQLVGRRKGQLRVAIEKTLEAAGLIQSEDTSTLDEIWTPVVSTGLRAVEEVPR